MADENENNNSTRESQSEERNPRRFDYTTTDTSTHLEKDKKD